MLPVVKEFGAAVIGLTMDDSGIPNDPEVRLSIAEKIIERATKLGIPTEDVVIDPLVLTVGADSKAGWVTLLYSKAEPVLIDVGNGHLVTCHRYEGPT